MNEASSVTLPTSSSAWADKKTVLKRRNQTTHVEPLAEQRAAAARPVTTKESSWCLGCSLAPWVPYQQHAAMPGFNNRQPWPHPQGEQAWHIKRNDDGDAHVCSSISDRELCAVRVQHKQLQRLQRVCWSEQHGAGSGQDQSGKGPSSAVRISSTCQRLRGKGIRRQAFTSKDPCSMWADLTCGFPALRSHVKTRAGGW